MSQNRYVAHGLISNGSAYLFLRRRNGRYLGGQWDIPGGTVEDGETSEGAAVRECFEETGLSAQCGGLITHFINTDTEGRNLTFHTMTYRLDWNKDETVTKLKISKEEHDDAKWLSIDEALGLPLVWHVRQTLDFVAERDEAASGETNI